MPGGVSQSGGEVSGEPREALKIGYLRLNFAVGIAPARIVGEVRHMIVRGIARGRMIELDSELPLPNGQPVRVQVDATTNGAWSVEQLIRAVQGPPHVTDEDVDELERSIEEAKISVKSGDLFGDPGAP